MHTTTEKRKCEILSSAYGCVLYTLKLNFLKKKLKKKKQYK